MVIDSRIHHEPPPEERSVAAAGRRSLPWWGFGLANLVVVTVLSLGFWYLLVDPVVSPLDTYPVPFQEVLFWAILMVVFIGFNLEFHGFDRIAQPWRGLVLIAVVLVLAIAITALMAAWGHLDPAFATGRAEGNGYVTPALYVLFGFFTYLTVVINWGHWPWRDRGLAQPWVGLAEILAVTGPTIILFVLFVLPTQASWARPGNVVLSLNTTVGWVYSVIIVAIVTGLLTDNWPWRSAGPGGRNAAASLVGNIVVGTGLYFVLLALSQALLGPTAVAALGDGVTKFPAQLGVCWVFWIVLWANAFGNWPTRFSTAANYATRIGITLVLGVITFVGYYFVLAPYVLHEPVVAGSAHGDALGWMDWMVLWILFYVVCLGSYGLPASREAAAEDGDPAQPAADDVPTTSGTERPAGEAVTP